jgi:hypothetical protein
MRHALCTAAHRQYIPRAGCWFPAQPCGPPDEVTACDGALQGEARARVDPASRQPMQQRGRRTPLYRFRFPRAICWSGWLSVLARLWSESRLSADAPRQRQPHRRVSRWSATRAPAQRHAAQPGLSQPFDTRRRPCYTPNHRFDWLKARKGRSRRATAAQRAGAAAMPVRRSAERHPGAAGRTPRWRAVGSDGDLHRYRGGRRRTAALAERPGGSAGESGWHRERLRGPSSLGIRGRGAFCV